MCQHWFAKLCDGEFSLDNAPWSDRQVEVDINQFETLIENNQCYTTKVMANILKISKSIKLLVKMKKVLYCIEKKINGFLANTINVCFCF